MVIKYLDQFGEILSGYIQYFYFVYFVLSFILLDTVIILKAFSYFWADFFVKVKAISAQY